MKLKHLFDNAIEFGIAHDPREIKEITLELKELKEKFDLLPKEEKEMFDKALLTNPYGDSHIYLGDNDKRIKTALVGIDLEAPEVLLAHELNKKGKDIDLLWAHHPEDKGLSTLDQVMHIQKFAHAKMGIPISIAEHVMDARISEVARAVSPTNHTRATDAAKLLGFAYINTHTPSDNAVTKYLQTIFDKKQPRKLKNVVNLLMQEPEYKAAVKHNAGPKIFFGSPDNFAGRCFVDMTGGTEGAKEIFKCLARAGVGTVVGMHFSEKHKKAAEEAKINLVVAGHMASDSLGMNLLIDYIEKKYTRFNIIECSGFRRFKRK